MKHYSKKIKGGTNYMFDELYANMQEKKITSEENAFNVAMESVKSVFLNGEEIDVSELSDEELLDLLSNVPDDGDDETDTLESTVSDPIRAVLSGEEVDDATLESVCDTLLGKDE